MAAAAEQFDQLVVDDLHDLLRRRQRCQDVLPHRLVLDAVDEGADDLEVDVGFEQRHANLAERLLDVLLRQPAAAAQLVEDGLQSRTQGIEHGNALLYGNIRRRSTRRLRGFGDYRLPFGTNCIGATRH